MQGRRKRKERLTSWGGRGKKKWDTPGQVQSQDSQSFEKLTGSSAGATVKKGQRNVRSKKLRRGKKKWDKTQRKRRRKRERGGRNEKKEGRGRKDSMTRLFKLN